MSKIIYNVTVNVDHDAHDAWLKWMIETHIPEVMQTGLFIENRFCKVLIDEEQGITYSIQYMCANMNDYNEYREKHATRLQLEAKKHFEGRFVAFRTLLQLV
ncbi:MAG: DUF4286 family protein [Bacteroidota bacterium]